MTRTLAAVVVAFVAFASFGQSTSPYIVGARVAGAHQALLKEMVGLDEATLQSRQFRDFDAIGQFSAELTESEAAALRGRPGIRFVERPVTVYAFGAAHPLFLRTEPASGGAQTIPWGISNVRAPETWPVSRGVGINVAVVDTGIDATNSDLTHQYAGGYNAIKKTNDTTDDDGHGTHVAGTIAAVDNFYGVVGVAPGALIWSVRALKHDPQSGTASGSTLDISAGIDWIVKKKTELGGNWIINMSLGICSDPTNADCTIDPPQSMLDACQKAADSGVLIFAASGNDSAKGTPKPVSFPAAFPSVVAVGAVDTTGTVADFSNQGPEVAIVAPGVAVHSTFIVGKGSDSHVQTPDSGFDSLGMVFAPTGTVTGRLIACATGKQASDFPAEVRGNVALIQRGDLTFAEKVSNAMKAGAAATVIYNNVPGMFAGTLGDASNPWHVTVSVSQEDGKALASRAGAVVTVVNQPGDYQWLDGTSMASPHAAGVAALVWGAAPNATAGQIANAMLTTARDLGPAGRDTAYGFGLIDAVAATKMIAPQFFTPQPPTGRAFPKRGH